MLMPRSAISDQPLPACPLSNGLSTISDMSSQVGPYDEKAHVLLTKAHTDFCLQLGDDAASRLRPLLIAAQDAATEQVGPVLLASQVAAGALLLCLRYGARDIAELVRHAPAALRGRDVIARLAAARTWATATATSQDRNEAWVLDLYRRGLDDVTLLLRKTAPQEEEAAASALVQTLLDPHFPEIVRSSLAFAWLGRMAPHLLIQRPYMENIAIAALDAGYQQGDVALWAGVRRQTVAKWYTDHWTYGDGTNDWLDQEFDEQTSGDTR